MTIDPVKIALKVEHYGNRAAYQKIQKILMDLYLRQEVPVDHRHARQVWEERVFLRGLTSPRQNRRRTRG